MKQTTSLSASTRMKLRPVIPIIASAASKAVACYVRSQLVQRDYFRPHFGIA